MEELVNFTLLYFTPGAYTHCRFCLDRTAYNRSTQVHQKYWAVYDVVGIPLVHAKFLENRPMLISV